MSVTCIAAVVLVTAIRPEHDNTQLIATIIGFILPTTMALLAFMKAQETHLLVTSRLQAFIDEARQLAQALGREEGRKEERDSRPYT